MRITVYVEFSMSCINFRVLPRVKSVVGCRLIGVE